MSFPTSRLVGICFLVSWRVTIHSLPFYLHLQPTHFLQLPSLPREYLATATNGIRSAVHLTFIQHHRVDGLPSDRARHLCEVHPVITVFGRIQQKQMDTNFEELNGVLKMFEKLQFIMVLGEPMIQNLYLLLFVGSLLGKGTIFRKSVGNNIWSNEHSFDPNSKPRLLKKSLSRTSFCCWDMTAKWLIFL